MVAAALILRDVYVVIRAGAFHAAWCPELRYCGASHATTYLIVN